MFTICDISHFVEKITLNSMVPSEISLIGQNLEKFELKVRDSNVGSYGGENFDDFQSRFTK